MIRMANETFVDVLSNLQVITFIFSELRRGEPESASSPGRRRPKQARSENNQGRIPYFKKGGGMLSVCRGPMESRDMLHQYIVKRPHWFYSRNRQLQYVAQASSSHRHYLCRVLSYHNFSELLLYKNERLRH